MACLRLLERDSGPLLVPQLVVSEVVYLLETLGTVDASVVAAAERLGVTRVATLDRKHFTVVRPAHAWAFEVLP